MKTDKSRPKVYGMFLLITGIVGGISALLTNMGMNDYRSAVKPPLTPPEIVFPVVWTILFTLMAISAARVWLTDNSRLKNHAVIVYGLQLFFNFFWSHSLITFYYFQHVQDALQQPLSVRRPQKSTTDSRRLPPPPKTIYTLQDTSLQFSHSCTLSWQLMPP